MAKSGGGEGITSIAQALERYGAIVRPEKLAKAKEAYDLLKVLADEKKSKEKHKIAGMLSETRGLSYDDVRTHHREAGGILFDVLRNIHKTYNLPGIWQNYIFLINVYMDSREYKRKYIENLYPSDYGQPMEVKVHHVTPRADYHPKQKEDDKNIEMDPIKYVLNMARSWDKQNQTLQKDLDTAKENHQVLVESGRKLYHKDKEQYEYIKRQHLESEEHLSKETETEKKVASKLFDILKYAVTKTSKSTDRELAQYALQEFHMLVDFHQANQKPVVSSLDVDSESKGIAKRNPLPDLSTSVSRKAQVFSGQNDWDYCLQKDHGTAEWKCINCDDCYCTPCKVIHEKGKKTGAHRLIHVSERDKEDAVRKEVFCGIHEDRELDMYCVTDKKAICVLCERDTDHKEHETTTLVMHIEMMRSNVGSSVTKVDKLIPGFAKDLEKVLNDKRLINTNHEMVDTIVKEFTARLEKTAEKLKAENEKKMSKLVEKEKELKKQEKAARLKVYETRKFLEECTQTELVKNQESLIEGLEAVVPESNGDSGVKVVRLSREDIYEELRKNLFN